MSFRILVLGGGFAGLEAARRLAMRPGTAVALVDPSTHALFTPRLVDALARDIPEEALRVPQAALAARHGYAFIQGTAAGFDHASKTADIRHADGSSERYPYDTLVCAYGGETNFYALAGQEHAFPFKTWEHLIRIEERLAALAKSGKPLRLAVIGGGATGIEAAFALDKRLRRLGVEATGRVLTVFQAGPQILPGFLPKTIARSEALLAERNIVIRLSTPIRSIAADGLETAADERVSADLVLWAAGIKPNVVPSDFPAEDPRGGLSVTHSLQAAPGLFAGGDVVRFRDEQRPVPKNAQTALKMGACLAENVWREHLGQPLKPFRYRSVGAMLWLGDTATTDLFGVSYESRLFVWLRRRFYDWRWKALRG